MTDNSLIWGIDLGGTKIEGVVLDSNNLNKPIIRTRLATEASLGYLHIIKQVECLVKKIEKAVGKRPSQIGFGTPGVLDPELQTMKNCNTTCLNGASLKRDLESSLGINVVLANDANCFALAEYLLGAARGANSAFGVIMGTGVGGGVVIDGKVISGLHGIAGEWGHNILIENGPNCYCGKKGCVESVISGSGLERFYFKNSKTERSLIEIAKLAKMGSDRWASATITRLNHYFGKAISVILNVIDPEYIVLGGGVSNIESLYQEGVAQARTFIFNNKLSTQIVRNQLGDSAGVFGAAMLVRTI